MHRLEHRGKAPLWIEVAGGGDADRPGHRRAKVREDVAEEIVGNHHVKARRPAHEMRGQNIDMVLLARHVGVALPHRPETLVPERHGMDDTVRLRRRGQLLLPRARQVEGELHHPVAAETGKDGVLNDSLLIRPGVKPPANLGILALVVFAHNVEIYRAGIGERRRHPLERPDRPQVDVLLEATPDRHQQGPERQMVRHGGPADGAEEDRVVSRNLRQPVFRHHAAKPRKVVAAPVKRLPRQIEAVQAGRGVHHCNALWNDLLADPVTFDDGYPGCRHRLPQLLDHA